ncbi:dynactin subunit P25 [Ramicandelaber brevisporus]|nr:dynactin subunit P25 [Ramicandelaber brevisporus]
MELPVTHYEKTEFIETDTGNKISRRAVIFGSQNIILTGKTVIKKGCVIRGDLRRAGGTGMVSSSGGVTAAAAASSVVIAIGRYCMLGENTVIRPPCKTYKNVFSYYPMKIGDHVSIGDGSIVEAAGIGSHVTIGKGCVIGRLAVIKDCVRIEDGTVIAPNTVVPSFSIFAGNPGRCIAELPECAQELIEARTKDEYTKFVPSPPQKLSTV